MERKVAEAANLIFQFFLPSSPPDLCSTLFPQSTAYSLQWRYRPESQQPDKETTAKNSTDALQKLLVSQER